MSLSWCFNTRYLSIESIFVPFIVVVCVQKKKKRKLSLLFFAFFVCIIFSPRRRRETYPPNLTKKCLLGYYLLIDRSVSICLFWLKSCPQASFGTPFAERRARCAHTAIHSCSDVHRKRAYDCFCLNLRRYRCLSHLKNLQKKLKKKCPGELF